MVIASRCFMAKYRIILNMLLLAHLFAGHEILYHGNLVECNILLLLYTNL